MAVKERQFEDVVTRLKMEAQQFGTRLRIVGDALEDLRIEVNEEEMEAQIGWLATRLEYRISVTDEHSITM